MKDHELRERVRGIDNFIETLCREFNLEYLSFTSRFLPKSPWAPYVLDVPTQLNEVNKKLEAIVEYLDITLEEKGAQPAKLVAVKKKGQRCLRRKKATK